MSERAAVLITICATAFAGCSDTATEEVPLRDLNLVENTCQVSADWATSYRPETSPFPERPTDEALILQPLEGGNQMTGGFGEILGDDIVRVEFRWVEAPTYACDGARLGETFSFQCESVPASDTEPDRCSVQLTPN